MNIFRKKQYLIDKHQDSNGTYRVRVYGLTGIEVNIYNMSENAVNHFVSIFESVVKDTLSVHYIWDIDSYVPYQSSLEVRMKPFLYIEDIRCKELDQFVSTYKESYKKYLQDPFAVRLDDIENVEYYPTTTNLELIFEYPSERAEAIRNVIRAIPVFIEGSAALQEYYIKVMGRYIKPQEHWVDYYKKEFEQLRRFGLVIPLSEAPIETVLNYLKMNQLRLIAKKLNLKVSERRKEDFINSLTLISNERVLKQEALSYIKGKVFYVKEIPISKDEFRWFDEYISELSKIIFGTIDSKIANFARLKIGREENGKKVVITNPGTPCKLCLAYQKRSYSLSVNPRKLPPYHIGCRCTVNVW